MSAASVTPLRPEVNPGAAVQDAHALTTRLSRELGIPTATTLLNRARPRPVDPALSGLFARGGLPRGEAVIFSGSHALSLALACCAGTTAEGGWCAGIGLEEPAAAAISDLGVDLSRFVCLDTPAQDWLRVVSILLESFAVLVVVPGFAASAAERSRLAAKLRESGATLLLLHESPSSTGRTFTRSTEQIEVLGETWEGLTRGAGRLQRRTLHLRSIRTGEHHVVLPDPRGRPATPTQHEGVPAGTLRLVES